jgi:hypothetical protein
MNMSSPHNNPAHSSNVIEMPAPTAWPFTLALGFTLLFTGLLTSITVSVLGLILCVAGVIGWFHEVFPREKEIAVPIAPEDFVPVTPRSVVEQLPVSPDLVRAWLPLETYPVSAGIKGGIAGSVAMAILACTYGIISTGSIWYPINLLAATLYGQSLFLTPGQLTSFHLSSFLVACLLHAIGSLLIGVLYGAMLPMIPRRPTLLGGLIAPILWSGLLYTTINLLNPTLGKLINWWWFTASQVAFGIVAGLVVIRQTRIPTDENIPFAMRAGVEAMGMRPPDDGANRP